MSLVLRAKILHVLPLELQVELSHGEAVWLDRLLWYSDEIDGSESDLIGREVEFQQDEEQALQLAVALFLDQLCVDIDQIEQKERLWPILADQCLLYFRKRVDYEPYVQSWLKKQGG